MKLGRISIRKLLVLTGAGVCLGIIGGYFYFDYSFQERDGCKLPLDKEVNSQEVVFVEINPLMEFDFMTREQIYQIRKEYVFQHPELVGYHYQPSSAVFGKIEDGKPWWGLLGRFYYGDGKKSIAGDSEESRFLVNPFLLVGLDDPYGYRIHNKSLKPKQIYPKPYNLVWNVSSKCARVQYNITQFWQESADYHFKSYEQRLFQLISYNARDLGYNYFYVDPKKSKNIVWLSKPICVRPILFFLHKGGSCGYPGGCNNVSPYDRNSQIIIKRLPARIYIKLWRRRPPIPQVRGEMTFIIDLL